MNSCHSATSRLRSFRSSADRGWWRYRRLFFPAADSKGFMSPATIGCVRLSSNQRAYSNSKSMAKSEMPSNCRIPGHTAKFSPDSRDFYISQARKLLRICRWPTHEYSTDRCVHRITRALCSKELSTFSRPNAPGLPAAAIRVPFEKRLLEHSNDLMSSGN